jgi:ketosteroid isomerase-like protein
MQYARASKLREAAKYQQLRTGLIVLLLTLVCFAAAPAQQTTNDDASRVMSLETIWNEAELNQDVRAVDHLLAEKFVYVDIDGSQQTKAEFLEAIKNRPEHIDTIGFDAASTNVTVYGNSAVVTGTYRERGSLHGKAYSRRGRFTDTWIKQGSAWVCVASQATMIEK